jgi:4'-phosphopantetheinyl transferase EntD
VTRGFAGRCTGSVAQDVPQSDGCDTVPPCADHRVRRHGAVREPHRVAAARVHTVEPGDSSDMLERLLPAGVICREAFDDVVPAPLADEEARVVARAVETRRREFATARRCAREALTALGVPARAVPSGPSREPCWPDGVVGSITHCAGYRAAAVARTSTVATVGVDAEPHERLPSDVLAGIALPEEADWVVRRARIDDSVHWDRLLFCAKEAVYKAWFPLARRWLGFEEATVTLGDAYGTFTARLHPAEPLVRRGEVVTEFSGHWLAERGLLLTAIASPSTGRG